MSTTNIMSKTRINIAKTIVLFVLLISSCISEKPSENIYFTIGEKIEEKEIVSVDTIRGPILVRKGKYKNDTLVTFYIYGKNNVLFLYVINDLNNNQFPFYYDLYESKFAKSPKFIDSTLSSGSFYCTKYIWRDSIKQDFAILSSCKNIHDTVSILRVNWDLEVGNDTLIEKIRTIDD